MKTVWCTFSNVCRGGDSGEGRGHCSARYAASLPRNTSPPLAQGQAEAVEIKSLSLTGDRVVDHYQPRTDLGRKLIELRRAHVQQGGKLLSWEEIDAEVRERRGGAADD